MKSNKLYCGTDYVSDNEPCFLLAEMNLQSPGSRGWHRYQILYVKRDDRMAEKRIDMGLSSSFKAGQFRIPGGWWTKSGKIEVVHTVAELQSYADDMRGNPPFDPYELAGCQFGLEKVKIA